MILFDVTIEASEGQREALRALLQRTMAASAAEAGCLIYRFTADLDTPDRFHLVELWQDEAALQAHAAGAPFRAFLAGLSSVGRIASSVARSGPLEPYSFRRPAA